MMNTRCFIYSTITLIALIFAMPPRGAHALYAQDALSPTLQIIDVDTTHFPQLGISISGMNWPVPLSTLPATVTLDGHPLTIDTDQTIQHGIQLALAIDINQLVAHNDAGQSGYVEMTGTLLDLVEANAFVRDEDWLAAYQLQGASAPLLVQDWTQEPNLIFNNIVGKRPPEISDAPLTAQALTGLLSLMADVPGTEALPRVLLLFSTGATIADLTPVVALAQAERVAIHVVELLGANGTPQSDTLQQLAAQSGGHYTALTSPDLSTTVSEALTAAHTVRLLQSRADSATPQSLTVAVTLPDNTTVDATTATAAFADLTVLPVQIAVAAPATETISWNDLAGDNTTDTGARLLPVQASFDWADGHPRDLLQVSYTLRGPAGFAQQEIRTAAPFDQTTLPLVDLADGDYSLEIRVLDELGLEAELATAPMRFSDLPSAVPSQPVVAAEATPAANVVGQPAQAQRNATNLEDTTTNDSPATAPLVQGTANEAQTDDTVMIPGLQVAVPRAMLLWSLPALLLLIGYLIYSERRERQRRQSDPQQTFADSSLPAAVADDPLFDLRDDARPLAGKRYQLNSAPQNQIHRYTIEDDSPVAKVPVSISNPGQQGRRAATATAPDDLEEHAIRRQAAAISQASDELVWDDDDDFEDEITVAPPRMEDEEATYRTQEVDRPLIGYLLRTTSDPNLPKELPIYSLNPAPGELRQIHIGRHTKHNTVVINDKSISREHAVLVQREGRLYLRDNASTAGTFLNWKRLNPGEELLLRHNDLLSFGQIAYEFRVNGEDEATVTNG